MRRRRRVFTGHINSSKPVFDRSYQPVYLPVVSTGIFAGCIDRYICRLYYRVYPDINR